MFFILIGILLSFSHFTGLLTEGENGIGHVVKEKYGGLSDSLVSSNNLITGEIVFENNLLEGITGKVIDSLAEVIFWIDGILEDKKIFYSGVDSFGLINTFDAFDIEFKNGYNLHSGLMKLLSVLIILNFMWFVYFRKLERIKISKEKKK